MTRVKPGYTQVERSAGQQKADERGAMKAFNIGKTRSRASIAIVCVGKLPGAVALAVGCGGVMRSRTSRC